MTPERQALDEETFVILGMIKMNRYEVGALDQSTPRFTGTFQ